MGVRLADYRRYGVDRRGHAGAGHHTDQQLQRMRRDLGAQGLSPNEIDTLIEGGQLGMTGLGR